MLHRSRLFALSFISLACMSTSFAAIPVDLSHQSVLALYPLTSQEKSRHVDFNGVTHIRIQQTYAGLPVWGADAVAHVQQGGNTALKSMDHRTTMNGIVYQDLGQDLGRMGAYITSPEQIQKAFMHVVNLHQQKTGIKIFDSQHAKKSPIIYVDKNNKAHFAYYISFFSGNTDGSPAVPTFILDAETFAVYETWDDLQSLDDVSGGGYGGNPKMGKIVFSGEKSTYPVLQMTRDAATNTCMIKNKNVEVKDDTDASGPFSSTHSEHFNCEKVNKKYGIYWDADQDAVNGGYSPANDALYIGTIVNNMYQDWYQVPVLTFFGMPVKLVMHAHAKDLFGQKMDNAFFFSLTNQMYFGDGVKLFYPLTSLGVGAHELSHGFTSAHSNLAYEKQSGGLNESYSDMAAQAAEYYALGKNSWQIGPEIVIGDGALRYMDDPTKDGHSIDNAHNYTDDLNVHYSSGVFNKVFYLISTAPGWNTKKAFDVMEKANVDYWTSSTNFIQAGCGALSAAKDYHYAPKAVANALKQVGLNPKLCQ